jgi:TRAP-type C4-dicarboxylate transport system permease small subunit
MTRFESMRSSGTRSSVNRVASVYGVILDAIRIATNAALVMLVVVVLAAVAVRYLGIFRGSLHWATEYSRFAIVWIAMLGSAVALDKGAHMAIDFTEQLPAAIRARVRSAGFIIGTVFLAVLAWQGFRLSLATMLQVSPALGLPMGYAYLAIPVGATIMTLQSVLFALMPDLARARRAGAGSLDITT